MRKPFSGRFAQVRFLQLAVFVLCLMLIIAVFPQALMVRSLLALAFLNTLFVTLSTVGHKPMVRGALLGVWVVGTLGMLLGEFHLTAFERVAVLTGQGAYFILIVSGIVATLRYVFKARRTSLDTIFAAVVAYLLIGIAFALLYTMMLVIDLGAFNVAGRQGVDSSAVVSSLMFYFSFVTIATLGYGDITPQLPLPQILAALEAVMGQFYIAIVIAWLVSRYVLEPNPENERKPP